jgi:hypothetical protein
MFPEHYPSCEHSVLHVHSYEAWEFCRCCQQCVQERIVDNIGQEEYVLFGDVARKILSEQCQYAVRYLDNQELAAGVHWVGDLADFHSVKIHRSDVAVFVMRVQDWLKVHR